MAKWNWKAAAAGGSAGLANGLFGAGGGMILVPLLSGWLKTRDKECFTTALAVILPMTVVSLVVYGLHGQLPWRGALPYLLGGFLGGVGGGLLLKRVPARWLHLVMGLLILWGGVRLWL